MDQNVTLWLCAYALVGCSKLQMVAGSGQRSHPVCPLTSRECTECHYTQEQGSLVSSGVAQGCSPLLLHYSQRGESQVYRKRIKITSNCRQACMTIRMATERIGRVIGRITAVATSSRSVRMSLHHAIQMQLTLSSHHGHTYVRT